MHKKLLEEIKKRKSERDLICLADLLEMVLDDMAEEKPDFYDHIESKLYENIYGKVVSEEMAKKWVRKMQPYGEKWEMEETTEVLKKNGLSLRDIDFYVVLNMMYNDFAKSVGDDTTMYIKLARDWLKDDDAKEDKLYNYYKYVVE